jgi:hypothetical protein
MYTGANSNIFWGEVYVESQKYLSWCFNNERIPVEIVPTSDGQPHIGAMTKAGDSMKMYLLSYNDITTVNSVHCYGI